MTDKTFDDPPDTDIIPNRYRYYFVVRDGQRISERDNFEQAKLYACDIHGHCYTTCPKDCSGHYDEVWATDNALQPGNGIFQLKPKDMALVDKMGRVTGKVKGWDYYHGRFFD